LGRRFRQKYRSYVLDADEDVQGNVQPTFIGVFDTVAALGNKAVGVSAFLALVLLVCLGILFYSNAWHWVYWTSVAVFTFLIGYWYLRLRLSQFKYFSPDPNQKLRFSNPLHWPSIWKNGHRAVWNLKNYDRWLDSDVQHARHALAIDEHRKNFPRVKWAMPAEAKKTMGRSPVWLKQVWFAGCHSDIGGSYPEPESRLSDISLQWMVDELCECQPEVQINKDMLITSPDPLGMQHEERVMFQFGPLKRIWPKKPRMVHHEAELHPSVIARLKAQSVSHVGDMKPYRPEQLRGHSKTKDYY
jgi:hypothetical protein